MPFLDPILNEPALLAGLAAVAAIFILGWVRERAHSRRVKAGKDPEARLKAYRFIVVSLWATAAICVLSWLLSDRSLAELGFTLGEPGWRLWAGWAICVIGGGYMLYSLIQAARSRETRDTIRKQLASSGDLDLVAPQTPREHKAFQFVSFTAGVTEETIFRGFLIGVFMLVMPLWAAAIAALAFFIIGHAYQGMKGMMRIMPISIGLTLVFLISGSLWPAIVLHWIVDAAGGGLMGLVQKTEAADAEAAGPEPLLSQAGPA